MHVAEVLREQIKRSPSWPQQSEFMFKQGPRNFDDNTCLLLDKDDTRYILSVDKDQFHKISDHYYCTDRHLWLFLAALIHPETKGAALRVDAFVRERCGWQGSLMPQMSWIFHTLCEVLLDHPVVKATMNTIRASLAKDIITVDGQWSTMLSVLYQRKHGQTKSDEVNPFAPQKHVAECN